MSGENENNKRSKDEDLLFFGSDDASNMASDLEHADDITQLLLHAGEFYYGQFVLLGYNGAEITKDEHQWRGKTYVSKMFFQRRSEPNGVKKGNVVKLSSNSGAEAKARALCDSNRHTVAYFYGKDGTVLVEYKHDPTTDMFQIGRGTEKQIDFTIVDTWLDMGADDNIPILSSPFGARVKKYCQKKEEELSNSSSTAQKKKIVTSTISRFACRILAERDSPYRVRIYAAGFDSSKNIFLGEKATKWQKKNGEFDGLTTNGVLLLHPNWNIAEGNLEKDSGDMYVWREVSVDGGIYTTRKCRSSTQRGAIVLGETNVLQDGTLIDLCGATLLWRSAEGLKRSPSKAELERRLDELNAGKPQCPVNLNTLVVTGKRHSKSGNNQKQPYVYFQCGHVQGKHDWGVNKNGSAVTFRCPICLVDSERVAQLIMGMESAFHLDSENLDYAFNPCGHMASKRTVSYWSHITMPHGSSSFHAVCPFCTYLLAADKPFVRLIFQDHCE